LLAGGLSPLATASPFLAPQTNVLFVFTDDLGWGDVGIFHPNSRPANQPRERTPNLDQFSAEGARPTSHSLPAPGGAPSPAPLLSGLTQGHANGRDNQCDKALADTHTIARVVREAGYATVAVGKGGLQGSERGEAGPATWPAFPTKRGFDHFFGYARHEDG